MIALIDTSFLLATVAPNDPNHALAREALRTIKSGQLIAAPVLTELFYMIATRVHYDAAVNTLRRLTTSGIPILNLTDTDYARMDQIMRQYRDARFDLADTAQMALAERLDMRQVYTFDHRDFRLFKPTHCNALDLLP